MARAGDEMVDPNRGERMIFRKTAKETDGELLQFDWIGKAGWKAGPLHVHRYQEERFEVISGTLGSHVAGVERIHEAGEVVVAPAGSVHTVWNAGCEEEEEVHSLVDFRPALRTESVFETVTGLAQDGKTNKAGVPKNPLRLALIMHDYEDEVYFAQPPLFVQRVIFGALAEVGRLLGYRAEYPYPYADRGEEPSVSEGERVSASSGARRGAVGVTLIIVAFLVSFLVWQRIRRSRR